MFLKERAEFVPESIDSDLSKDLVNGRRVLADELLARGRGRGI